MYDDKGFLDGSRYKNEEKYLFLENYVFFYFWDN